MYKILVDNIGANEKLAWTTNAQKIVENRNLLRSVPFANSVKIVGLNGGTVSLFSDVRYITAVQIKPDTIPDKMYFIDYEWEMSKMELKTLLQGIYTE